MILLTARSVPRVRSTGTAHLGVPRKLSPERGQRGSARPGWRGKIRDATTVALAYYFSPRRSVDSGTTADRHAPLQRGRNISLHGRGAEQPHSRASIVHS